MRAALHYLAEYEEEHTREPSSRRSAGRRQSSAGGADLPVGEVLVRRYRRDVALRARRTRGFFLLAYVEPDLDSIATLAGPIAGQRRLPADGVGCRHDCREPAVALQTGRSHSRVRRVVWADALHRAASAGQIRGDPH